MPIYIRLILFVVFLGSVGHAQIAENPIVNELKIRIENDINRANGTYDDAVKKGPEFLKNWQKRMANDSILGVTSENNGYFDLIRFIVPIGSEYELKNKWLKIILKICKRYPLGDSGVKVVIISMGAPIVGQLSLIVDPETLKTQLVRKARMAP